MYILHIPTTPIHVQLTDVHNYIISGSELIILSVRNSVPPAPGRHGLEGADTCKE